MMSSQLRLPAAVRSTGSSQKCVHLFVTLGTRRYVELVASSTSVPYWRSVCTNQTATGETPYLLMFGKDNNERQILPTYHQIGRIQSRKQGALIIRQKADAQDQLMNWCSVSEYAKPKDHEHYKGFRMLFLGYRIFIRNFGIEVRSASRSQCAFKRVSRMFSNRLHVYRASFLTKFTCYKVQYVHQGCTQPYSMYGAGYN
ncbi:hypothetical protein CLF_100800 [Clonorchis sinensis]|uniref:Uncharacterized protein n=1 Tax=Clonorchis sinensis TaxID=79923 RepID=G7Y4A0_CLOSI|nr:hypothetical protein CLF_100800 [Clonorchis sinensis]